MELKKLFLFAQTAFTTLVKITTIYEKLAELKIGKRLSTEDYECFFPCPDREDKRWLPKLSPFLSGELSEKKNLQCCGMGGCAFIQEPELSKEMAEERPKEKKLISYCATCIGQFARYGESEHFLPLILETKETADYTHSFLNRLKHKFY